MMYPAPPPEPIPVIVLPSHQEVALEPPGMFALTHWNQPTQNFPTQNLLRSPLERWTSGYVASAIVAQVQPPLIRRSDGSQIPTPNLPGSVPIGENSPSPLFYPAWAQPRSPSVSPEEAPPTRFPNTDALLPPSGTLQPNAATGVAAGKDGDPVVVDILGHTPLAPEVLTEVMVPTATTPVVGTPMPQGGAMRMEPTPTLSPPIAELAETVQPDAALESPAELQPAPKVASPPTVRPVLTLPPPAAPMAPVTSTAVPAVSDGSASHGSEDVRVVSPQANRAASPLENRDDPLASPQENRTASPLENRVNPLPATLPTATLPTAIPDTSPPANPADLEETIQKSQADTVPIFAPPTPEQPPLREETPPPTAPTRPSLPSPPNRPESTVSPEGLEQPAAIEVPAPASDTPSDTPSEPDETESPIAAPDAPETAPTAETLEIPSPDATAEDLLASPSDVVELTSDQQEYDEQRQIVTATGNVELRFRRSVLTADRLQVNLANRFIMAEGNVALRRGEQVLRGERFEYRFVQEEGTIFNANGELFLPTSGTDFAFDAPAATAATGPQPLLSDRALATQPLRVQRGPADFQVGVGVGRDAPDLKRQGAVRRLRFEADHVDFNAFGWQAQNVRITNDPFAPAELELRTPEATLTHISPQADELITRRPRLVFDQGFSVPLLRERTILSKERREPGLVNIRYDQEERGGVYIERSFNVIPTGPVRLRVTPQLLVQKAINEGPNPLDPALYGLIARLDGTLSPQTSVRGVANFASLDFEDLADNLRASVRVQQEIGDHNLNLEYSYRDRLFNGSLGFQDVQSSLGVVLASPTIPLGEDGPRLNYQVGAQVVNAETDKVDLLDPGETDQLVELGRYQATAALSQRLSLWQGTPLPPTATEGLRYSPVPIVPFVRLVAGMRGILTSYTSGDFQNALTGSLALEGQFGNFNRDFLDYTAFNVRYSQSLRDGESPFKFDRIEDRRVLAFSLSQQVYGPLRFGFQTAVSLDKEDRITTDYILEYSRRTYGVVLRFNPVLQIGSINLRISDFNWNGNPEPFPDMDVRPVSDGVVP